MTTERSLYKRITKHLPGAVDRVENSAAPGMPDYSATYHALDYWVEAKVDKTVRGKKDITDLMEPSQKAWLIKRVTVGLGCMYFLLVYKERYREYDLFEYNRIIQEPNKIKIVFDKLCAGSILYVTTELERRLACQTALCGLPNNQKEKVSEKP